MAKHALALCAVALLLSCSAASPPKQADNPSGQAAAAVANGTAETNPLCRLYTPDELTTYLGRKPGAGEDAAMGTGCQWSATDDNDKEPVFVQIQVVPAAEGLGENAVPSGAPGFRSVPALGRVGFVANDVGWKAGAFVGTEWVGVTVSAPSATAEKAITFFKDVVARRRTK